MKKVRCIDSKYCKYITNDKIYDVIDYIEGIYIILDDNLKESHYRKERFEEVKDDESSISSIKDMKKLWQEGKLKQFVVNDKCDNEYLSAYTYRNKKLLLTDIYEDLLIESQGNSFLFEYIDLQATSKLIIKEKKEMTKADLRDGMVCEIEDGRVFKVMNHKLMNSNNSEWSDLLTYKDNLKNINEDPSYNIIAVYEKVWKYEKSPTELKIEGLQKQVDKLRKTIAELKNIK